MAKVSQNNFGMKSKNNNEGFPLQIGKRSYTFTIICCYGIDAKYGSRSREEYRKHQNPGICESLHMIKAPFNSPGNGL